MEENYSVQNKLHDKKATTNPWSNNVVMQSSDPIAAEKKWHEEIARLISAYDYDYVAVIMLDTQGHSTSWYRDSRVAPAPQAQDQQQ